MKTKDLREIAEANGLTWIETTTDGTGYPKNLRGAIIGFDTFEGAHALAEIHGLEIERFEKKKGWSLWWRTGNWADSAFEMGADLFGENYFEYYEYDEKDFFENEVKPKLEEITDIEELYNFTVWADGYNTRIQSLSDDEVLILETEVGGQVYKKEQMEYEHDSRWYAIGVIEKK